jgi:hypothetical protein
LRACNIKVQILNSLGQQVYAESQQHNSGDYLKVFDMAGLPKGIYFVEINAGEERVVKKVVLQ